MKVKFAVLKVSLSLCGYEKVKESFGDTKTDWKFCLFLENLSMDVGLGDTMSND